MLPEALPYHLKVRDHFKQQGSTWEFLPLRVLAKSSWPLSGPSC
ncbi:hypothetical protein ACQ86N_45285 [Puia sp. P3]